MHIEVITEHSKFLALGSVWNKLLERSGIDHPFLTHEWISVWWDCFGESAAPYILTVVSGADIVAIAPLMLSRARLYGCPIRRLQAIVNVYTERFDLLLGLHAHGCNIQIIDASAANDIGFVLMPCCVIDEPLYPVHGITWVQSLTDYAIRQGFQVRPFQLAFSGQSIGIYAARRS